MFCPNCKDEFRAGFTRCEDCGVDLVQSLDQAPPAPEVAAEDEAAHRAEQARVRVADYCGFLTLDEARHARDLLRAESIRSDIVIRASPETRPDGPVLEEYWLRIEASRFEEGAALLDGPESVADGGAARPCPGCGHSVPELEVFCTRCGHRFKGAR